MSSFAGEKAINIVKEAEKRIKYKFEEIDDICLLYTSGKGT